MSEGSNTEYSNKMKVTAKGQVTIPARIRRYLGLRPHADVDFQVRKGQVVLVAAKQTAKTGRGKFASVRGILGGKLTTGQWMKVTRGH